MAQVSRSPIFAFVSAVAAFGLVVAAQSQTPAPPRPAAATFRPAAGAYQFLYDVDLLGTPVIALDVDVSFGRDTYDVAAQIKTVGLANWLFSWTQKISS